MFDLVTAVSMAAHNLDVQEQPDAIASVARGSIRRASGKPHRFEYFGDGVPVGLQYSFTAIVDEGQKLARSRGHMVELFCQVVILFSSDDLGQ